MMVSTLSKRHMIAKLASSTRGKMLWVVRWYLRIQGRCQSGVPKGVSKGACQRGVQLYSGYGGNVKSSKRVVRSDA